MAYEAVNNRGELFVVPHNKRMPLPDGPKISDPQNFARAVDPHHTEHEFCEHWQGVHNVRFLEKLNGGRVVDWVVVWGQPKHSMKAFYDACASRWPELLTVSFKETFCAAIRRERKMAGGTIRVQRLELQATRERLSLQQMPAELASGNPPFILGSPPVNLPD